MGKGYTRSDRVAQQLQKEIAVIIQREIKDGRLGMVTVSSVDLSRDLSHAKVYVTFLLLEHQNAKEALEVLNQSKSYIRGLLAKEIRLRLTPELQFCYDESLVEGMRLSNLVTQVIKNDEEKSNVEQTTEQTVDQIDLDKDHDGLTTQE